MATIKCVCPLREGQTRHPDGDTITLRERIDTPSALAMRWRIMQLKSENPDVETYEVLGVLSELYLLFGIESWTLVDEDGKPLPVTKPHIRRQLIDRDLSDIMPVVEEADERYFGIVIGPLADPASTSSPPTPTAGSTSARTASTPTPLRRSKRSSTSTTPTDDTGTTTSSPGGGSSSSPSEASAA